MTIAVIGHARSPEGRGWGERIDACNVVVRMYDWEWQPLADYGERYDYGIVALIPFSLKPFLEAVNKPQPAKGWLGYARGREPVNMAGLPKMEVISQDFRDIGISLGGSPGFNLTRGCAAACWAVNAAGQGGTVILVGFDNLKAGLTQEAAEAFPDAVLKDWDERHPGWRDRLYRGGATKHGSHDIAIERVLLEKLAADRGVNLQFAEDVWP